VPGETPTDINIKDRSVHEPKEILQAKSHNQMTIKEIDFIYSLGSVFSLLSAAIDLDKPQNAKRIEMRGRSRVSA